MRNVGAWKSESSMSPSVMSRISVGRFFFSFVDLSDLSDNMEIDRSMIPISLLFISELIKINELSYF